MAQGGLFPAEIIPGFLYLGNLENASSKVFVEPLGITHILNAADELFYELPIKGMKYLKTGLDDIVTEGPKFESYLPDALTFIGKQHYFKT